MRATATLTQPVHRAVNQTQVTLLGGGQTALTVDAIAFGDTPIDPEEMLQLVRKLMAGGKA